MKDAGARHCAAEERLAWLRNASEPEPGAFSHVALQHMSDDKQQAFRAWMRNLPHQKQKAMAA